MEMYDPDEVINSRKPLKEKTENDYPFMSRWRMEDGEFDMKFLSHSEKCPDGFRLMTTHRFESKPGQAWKDQPAMFCSEVKHGMRPAAFENEEGEVQRTFVPIKPCFVCDFLEEARRLEIPEDEDDDDSDMVKWFETLDEDIQKILNQLTAGYSRTWCYPVIVYAKRVEDGKTAAGKTKYKFVPSETPMGAILELRPGADKADAKMYKLIYKLASKEGDQFFHPNGLWVTYTKGNPQEMETVKSRKMTAAEEKIYKTYPKINEQGNGVTSGSFQRPSLHVSYDRAKAMVENSYWGKALVKRHGFTFDDIEEGLACELENEVELDDKPKKKGKPAPVKNRREEEEEDEPKPKKKLGGLKQRKRSRTDEWVDEEVYNEDDIPF